MSEEGSRFDALGPGMVALIARMQEWVDLNPSASEKEVHRRMLRFSTEHKFSEAMDATACDLVCAFLWETDRGCVLVAAQIVDEELEAGLRTFFSQKSSLTKKELDFWFVGPTAPLLSTGLKMRLARAIGLIDRQHYQAIEKLQHIRSRMAAHSRKVFELTDQHATDLSSLLPDKTKDVYRDASGLREDLSRVVADFPNTTASKVAFWFVTCALIISLQSQMKRALTAPDHESGGSSK